MKSTIHPPTRISSIKGLGLNTSKTMKHETDNFAVGTEIWGELEKPWRQGETIIALPGYKWVTQWEVGKPYIITKFYDAEGNFIATYCDVARPLRRVDGGFETDDLYLDVWQVADSAPIILDEDELEIAITAGHITKDEAMISRQVADNLCHILQDKRD
jgi:predicted RNA-binding protein associated with RNAse of E/G family